mgnify:FL=1
MSNADRSYDLTLRGRTNGPAGEYDNGRVPLDVRPSTAAQAFERPTVHLWTPPCDQLTVYAPPFTLPRELLYPAILTWEVYLGGRGAFDRVPAFRRKTALRDAQDVRGGLVFSALLPTFHQVLVVTRLGPTVGGVPQTALVSGTLDLTVERVSHGGGLRVAVGSVIG